MPQLVPFAVIYVLFLMDYCFDSSYYCLLLAVYNAYTDNTIKQITKYNGVILGGSALYLNKLWKVRRFFSTGTGTRDFILGCSEQKLAPW